MHKLTLSHPPNPVIAESVPKLTLRVGKVVVDVHRPFGEQPRRLKEVGHFWNPRHYHSPRARAAVGLWFGEVSSILRAGL